MTPEALPDYIWLFIKVCVIVGIGLYTLFAGIILRQEQLMERVLEEQFEPILRLLTIIHLLASVAVFFLAVILL